MVFSLSLAPPAYPTESTWEKMRRDTKWHNWAELGIVDDGDKKSAGAEPLPASVNWANSRSGGCLDTFTEDWFAARVQQLKFAQYSSGLVVKFKERIGEGQLDWDSRGQKVLDATVVNSCLKSELLQT